MPAPFTAQPLTVFGEALTIARSRTRDSGRELFAGGRGACWECHRLCQPFNYFMNIIACAGLNHCTPFIIMFGAAAAIIGTALWLPFCAARRHESDSFAVVVTESLIVQVEDFVACSCPPFESENFAVVVTEGLVEDFTGCWKKEERAILVIKISDVARARVNCVGVEVYLKDPGTGAAKVIKGDCCFSDSKAPPDHVWLCVQEPERLVSALRGSSRAANTNRCAAGSGEVGGAGGNGGGVSRDVALAAMRSAARSGAAKPTQAQADLFSL